MCPSIHRFETAISKKPDAITYGSRLDKSITSIHYPVRQNETVTEEKEKTGIHRAI